ncbi:MAG TPA: porin [Gemmatimonadaceae bacterium]|nr:porin [Gemmatimonadaceae bacterium]
MTSYMRFAANIAIAIVCLTLTAAAAIAQSSAPITFDGLPRAKREPSPASSPAKPRAAAPARAEKKVARDITVATTPAVTTTPYVATVVAMIDSAEQRTAGSLSSEPQQSQERVPALAARADKDARPPRADSARKPAAPAAPVFQSTAVAGLLQVQVTGGDGSAQTSTYRIRRAELKLTSDLGHKAQGIVMVDVAKALSLSSSATATTVNQSSRVLQDALITMPLPHVTIDAGQQRVPLGLEGTTSGAALETIERALMESSKTRGASFGDVRDLGAAAKGTWKRLDYKVGVFNGTGETMNDADRNAAKSVAAILGVKVPLVPGLRAGASGATSGSATADKPARDRIGVDVKYAHDWLTLQTEAMTGRDGSTTRRGMYALLGIAPMMTIKLVARFDAWDPNTTQETSAADVTERDYLVGGTWVPAATRLKLQVAAVRKTYTYSITPAVTLLLMQLQASW